MDRTREYYVQWNKSYSKRQIPCAFLNYRNYMQMRYTCIHVCVKPESRKNVIREGDGIYVIKGKDTIWGGGC